MTSVTVTLQKDSRHLVFRCSKRAVHIIEKPIFRVFSLLDLVFTHAVHPPDGRRVNSVCSGCVFVESSANIVCSHSLICDPFVAFVFSFPKTPLSRPSTTTSRRPRSSWTTQSTSNSNKTTFSPVAPVYLQLHPPPPQHRL